MKFYTGLVLLFLFILSSLFASILDLIERRNLRRKQSKIEIINICCSILVFTYFFYSSKYFFKFVYIGCIGYLYQFNYFWYAK